jgi:hypothetical protein
VPDQSVPQLERVRLPETHTGDTNAKKQAIEEFLAARGYVIAPHTIDSEDFMFNVAYFSA